MDKTNHESYRKIISELQASLGWTDLVLSDINDGIIVFDSDLRVIFANDLIADLLGKIRIKLLGQPVWEVLKLKSDKLLGESHFRDALKQKKLRYLSGRYDLLNAEKPAKVDIHASFIKSLEQTVIIVYDITEQLKNEQALMNERIARIREQAERKKVDEDRRLFQNIIGGTLAIVSLKNMDGEYELVNNRFEETFGLSGEEVEGKTDHELFSGELAEVLNKNDEQVIKERVTIRNEESIRFKDETRHYLYSKYPLFNQQEDVIGICSVLTDITKRKSLEESKNNFIRMVHHELNTPLTVMKLFLRSTRMNIEKGEMEEALNDFSKIEDQIEQMAKLTDDLLDATKMEKAELTFSKEEFNITDLVKDTIENEQAKTEKHDIQLVGNPKQHQILADKQRIGQVMRNLLSNAVKYSPNGGEINIRIKGGSKYVTVSVQDFGIGIPKGQQENIFEQFNRGGIGENDFSGFGIGLYITAEIIKNHEGKISVESEEGKGSTFSFRLPV